MHIYPEGASLSQTITHVGIGAHPDDLEILAFHGIFECYDKHDRGFMGITVCDGAGSPRAGRFSHVSDAEMVEIRKKEQIEAAKLGKYKVQALLGFSSQKVKSKSNDVKGELKKILASLRPQILYTHNLADKHDTHVALAQTVIEVLRDLPQENHPLKLYGCEVWRDLDWLPDSKKIILDVTGQEELAEKLCAVFESQIAGGKRYDLGTMGRRRAHATFNEAHQTDKSMSIILAMDMTELIRNKTISTQKFVESLMNEFKEDVVQRLQKVSR